MKKPNEKMNNISIKETNPDLDNIKMPEDNDTELNDIDNIIIDDN